MPDVPHEVYLLVDIIQKDTGSRYVHNKDGLIVDINPPGGLVVTVTEEQLKLMKDRRIAIHGATPMQLYLSLIHQIFNGYNPPIEYECEKFRFKYLTGMLYLAVHEESEPKT